MEHKKFFKIVIIVSASVLVLMLGLQIMRYPLRAKWHRNRTEFLKAHVAKLVKSNQDLLTATAQSIKSLPVDPAILSRIQSDIFQKQVEIRLYLWMSGTDGSYVFGIPSEAFTRVNAVYDNLTARLPEKKQFISRNEFLLQFVDEAGRVDLSAPELLALESLDLERPFRDLFDEMRSRDDDEGGYVKSRTFVLSAPVINDANAALGNLFLKVDDYANRELYYTRYRAERRDFFGRFEEPINAFTILPFIFLWFLFPTWVYLDAKKRDVKNVGVWVILTVVSSIFGLIIYMIARPAAEKALYCAKCGKEINGSKSFCPHCGHDLSKSFCPECQYPVKPEWEYCPSCRAAINPRGGRPEQ